MMNFATLSGYWHFMLAGITQRRLTGGVIPSQRFLIDKMIALVPPEWPGTVLELGAGTGALTVRLATRCASAQILACEINPVLAADLKQRLADAGLQNRVEVFIGSAQRLLSRFRSVNREKPAYILSGIPLATLDHKNSTLLIDQITDALPEGGTYVQFQYSLMDRGRIQARLPVLQTVPVLLNFPPAFIYYAQKTHGKHAARLRSSSRS